MKTYLLFLVILLLMLAGCANPPSTPDSALPTATAVMAETVAPAAAVTPTTAPAVSTDAPAPEPTATIAPMAATPLGQQLAAQFNAPVTAAGEVILATGRVLDRAGNPLGGVAVEFWQTDSTGVYDHPGDAGTANRDRGFQFYGTATTDGDGRYLFRTVQPGYYEPRPRHIHIKVKQDGTTLLTTQFYFEEDRSSLTGEGVFAQAGNQGDLLIFTTLETVTLNGTAVDVLTNDLVIDTGTAGTLPVTPAQAEGPYYPVAAVAAFDNDLAAVP